MAGIGAGVGSALGSLIPGSDIIPRIERGILGSALTQGIGVATGLQRRFDWSAVAAAGVEAAVSGFIDNHLQGSGASGTAIGFLSGGAGLIANAATRSLINGSDFGDNILAALPDFIGQTLGNAVAGALSSPDQLVPDYEVKDNAKISYDGPEMANTLLVKDGFKRQSEDVSLANAIGMDPLVRRLAGVQLADNDPHRAVEDLVRQGQAEGRADREEKIMRGEIPIPHTWTQTITWSNPIHDATFPTADASEMVDLLHGSYLYGHGNTVWVDPVQMEMEKGIDVGEQVQISVLDDNGYMHQIYEQARATGQPVNFNSSDWHPFPGSGLLSFNGPFGSPEWQSVGRFAGRVDGVLTANADGSYWVEGSITFSKPGNGYSWYPDAGWPNNLYVIGVGTVKGNWGTPMPIEFTRRATFRAAGTGPH